MTATNMSTPHSIELQRLYDAAMQANAVADTTKAALMAMVRQAMVTLLPVGAVFDLRERKQPAWLFNVRTQRGNDRGTRIFRITAPPRIELDVAFIELARWTCSAVPISEVTGKDMSGKAHGADGAGGVWISAQVCEVSHSELTGQAYHDHCMQSIKAVIEHAAAVRDGAELDLQAALEANDREVEQTERVAQDRP